MNNLEKLFEAAYEKANSTGTLDDIDKAANVAKANAEVKKAESDVANSRAQMRLEGLKSFATFLVPIVSLLTIAFTVYIQLQQLRETQFKDEDTQWREFLSSIRERKAADAALSDPTFEPRLRSFFSSSRYGDQARSVSKRMLGQVANEPAFRDLFGLTIGDVNSKNFADVVDVGRTLAFNSQAAQDRCTAFTEDLSDDIKDKLGTIQGSGGICSRGISEKTIRTLGLTSDQLQKLSTLRLDQLAFEAEQWFLSKRLAEFLRSNYSVGSASDHSAQSLSSVYIAGVDLSNVDFSSFDLTDTVFDSDDLSGARITPRKTNRLDIRWTAWWEAESVDQNGLEVLTTTYYPYYVEYETFWGQKVFDRNYYEQRILALCVPPKEFCKPENLKFGTRTN